MTDHDEHDLSAAFEQLTAPRSTANYTARAPVEVRTTTHRWPQAVAGVLAVLVALAGAGTFLALRNARQNGLATSSAGNPPARSGAAMAYDSSAGVTVMYGGTGGSGQTLNDTWVWDGSSWKASDAKGPGTLVSARLSDDPADGGVLLIGLPAPRANSSSSGVACVIGASGSGSASGGSVSSGGSPGLATGAPASTLATAPPTAPGAHSIPISPCPSPAPLPLMQTWLFTAHGWSRVAPTTSAANTPSVGAQLAYDAASGDVLAVATTFYGCGGPLASSNASQGAIACPMEGASSAGNPGSATGASKAPASSQACVAAANCLPTAMPCREVLTGPLGCGINNTVTTWVWSGGRWTARTAAGPAIAYAPELFGGAGLGHATLLATLFGTQGICKPVAGTGNCSNVTDSWSWTGSKWSASYSGQASIGPGLPGAASAGVGGTVVVVDTSGQTWTWASSKWTHQRTASAPSARIGAAMAAGPANTVVLFGGMGEPRAGLAFASRLGVGSDTWTWDGAAWHHAAGAPPLSPAPVTPCLGVNVKGIPCVEPMPAQVLPGTPAAVPGSAPAAPAATPSGGATIP